MNNYKKTDKLLDILKKSPTVDDYIENENDNLVNMTLSEYLNKILSDRNLKTSDLVKLTGLDRTYTYQIMSGRKNPSRDKVIAICFALNMSFEDTLDYYKDLKGPMAEKIRASISEDGSFVLNEEGWCPLLNEKGLCEVCLTLGEDSLSEVCTEYPRFTTEYPKTREKVLCLSCGEVGRIVFSDTEQIGFDEQILSEDYDEYEWEDGDDELAEKLESVRSHAIGLLQDRSRPIAERIAVYLNYCCQMQKQLFGVWR